MTEQHTTETTEETTAEDEAARITEETSPQDGNEETSNERDHDTDEAEGQQQDGKASREAAKYRRQLRTVEAERDELAQQVEGLQRDAVLNLAAGHLSQPADLLDVGGVELADLLDNGNVDPEKVADAAAELVESRPGLGKTISRPPTDTPQERHHSLRRNNGANEWAEAMRTR